MPPSKKNCKWIWHEMRWVAPEPLDKVLSYIYIFGNHLLEFELTKPLFWIAISCATFCLTPWFSKLGFSLFITSVKFCKFCLSTSQVKSTKILLWVKTHYYLHVFIKVLIKRIININQFTIWIGWSWKIYIYFSNWWWTFSLSKIFSVCNLFSVNLSLLNLS